MKFFVRPTDAPKAKTKNTRTISIVLAGVFIVMAVAQLFTFEKYPDVFAAMWLPGGDTGAHVYASVLVVLEVFAVPFLLMMRLSPLMRATSMAFGWLTIAGWFVLALWQNLSPSPIANSGVLGATIPLSVGWWTVYYALALGVLAAWVGWGMWPFTRAKKADSQTA